MFGEGDDATGWRIFKLDEDAHAEGKTIYHLKGAIQTEETRYSTIYADDLGKRWGEGTYLIIDLGSVYGGARTTELIVVQDAPTYSEYREPEPETEPVEAANLMSVPPAGGDMFPPTP